jgi:multiple sugar transport system ATP-binding protein
VASITFDDVTKRFHDGTVAVASLSLDVEDGECMVLVGPSGCGKTTALRMVAGLEDVTSGSIRIGDDDVTGVDPRRRDLAMVFQSYALYPHMSVRDNLAYSLFLRKRPKREIDGSVKDTAALLGLAELLARRPKELSGGQRQRVAMGRAIVREPRAFLMDEPLSNLDAKLRVQMRAQLALLRKRLGATTIYVTHDQTEAMTMGDRLAVMRKGELQQVDTPTALYEEPQNLFVAGFIGSPAMNVLPATLEAVEGGVRARFGSHALELPADRPAVGRFVGRDVLVGIRPESFEDAVLVSAPPGHRMTVTCTLREDLGSEVLAHFGVDVAPPEVGDAQDLAAGVAAELGAGPQTTTPCTARLLPDTQVREGRPIELAVDVGRVKLFDPDTNLAI